MPQCQLVLFGASHDRGYVPLLSGLKTDGLNNKIHLLQTYSNMPVDVSRLGYTTTQNHFANIFMTEKLGPNNQLYIKPGVSPLPTPEIFNRGKRACFAFQTSGER